MFDTEEWSIIAADTPTIVASAVSNVVQVSPAKGRAYSVCIRVPTAVFHYLREVAKLTPEVANAHPCTFCVEEVGGVWYFCLEYGKPRKCIDLWTYKSLPHWANRSREVYT